MQYINHAKVYSLINEILKRHGINLQLKTYVDLLFKKDGIIGWNSTDLNHRSPVDRISNYLNEKIFFTINPTQKIFYHFLPKLRYLENILYTDEIRMYNLNKYLKGGDKTEYQHFLKIIGIDITEVDERINYIKDNVFIWCLTDQPADKINSKKHWNEYADKGNGVAISFEIEFNSLHRNIIDLVRVYYELNFLKEIQAKLKKEFGLRLEILSFHLFAKYFKRENYQWERETRLCLDKGSWNIHNISSNFWKHRISHKTEYDNLFSIKKDENNDTYISIPWQNTFFKVNIKEIFCTQEQSKKLLKNITIEHRLKNENINIVIPGFKS